MSTSSWMKDIQDRVKRASNDVNTVLQPRVAQAKRSLEASIQQLGLKAGPELFQDDKQLYVALTDLDNIRDVITNLSRTVEQYRSRLLDVARSQTQLSVHLHNIVPPPSLTSVSPTTATTTTTTQIPIATTIDDQSPETETDHAQEQNSSTSSSYNFLSEGRINTQEALAQAESASANLISRFALDMSTPMADLARTFEETLSSKITPLRRRYLTQKREYLSYSKQATDTDTDDRRRNSPTIPDASSAWKSTSETLLAEIRSLIAYTLSKFSEWNLNVAQAQHQMFTFSAEAFQQSATLAEATEDDDNDSIQIIPPSL